MGALGAVGIIGAGDQSLTRPEHFDAKYVVVSPAGPDHPDGVTVRETVDIDFGLTERRGYQRIIPHDFGLPVDVTASSPDANDELDVLEFRNESRIRIGNRNITFTGQRRYILEYTLPEAQLGSRDLNLDIIGHDETFVTDRFTIVTDGFEFTETRCDVGERGDFGGCELVERDDGTFITTIDRLEPGDGITIGGPFSSRAQPEQSVIPALPERNPSGIRPFGFALAAIGGLAAAGSFFRLRRLGSNEVFGAGGAADAAFGELPVPEVGDVVADVPTYRVPDDRLAELATIEFVPPRGLEPWQGRVLLQEVVDSDTVAAWFAEMIARNAIRIEDDKLRHGTDVSRLNAVDRRLRTSLFAGTSEVDLGTYSSKFAGVWKDIAASQTKMVDDSGWWDPPLNDRGRASATIAGLVGAIVFVAIGFINFGSESVRNVLGGIFVRQPGAIVLTVLLMLLVASNAYGFLRRSRTAVGSALALRTESFRRFLIASEGQHVDWAWEQGVVREYSAWAVALDAATAWSAAIEASDVNDPSISVTGPLAVHTMSQSFVSTMTPPSSSSSGGGGGYSGGGSGSGGGGGSSGSW